MTAKTEEGKDILFIVGCQRSGTTLMSHVFDRDFNTYVFGEHDSRIVKDYAARDIRLKDLAVVKETIAQQRASLVILKPLSETQNTVTLLNYFPGSRALWVYRNYEDVVESNLKIFGMQVGMVNLGGVLKGNADNWRSNGYSEETRRILRQHFSEDMNPYDAQALFWLARNNLYFELGLDQDPRVYLSHHDDFITKPIDSMKRLYRFLGRDFPGNEILEEVNAVPKRKAKSEISPEIRSLCASLQEKLDRIYQERLAEDAVGAQRAAPVR